MKASMSSQKSIKKASAKASGKAYPSIDCPFATKTEVSRYVPFKTTAEYITHLEKPKRQIWKKHHLVIKALGLKGDEVITDLGAGAGSFTLRFAPLLPKGRVHALDILPGMLNYMKKRAAQLKLNNITFTLTDPHKPTLGPNTTLAFTNNVLHFVEHPKAWITHIASQLPKGGRLAIMDFKMGKLPLGPPDDHKVSPDKVIAYAKAAGLTLKREEHTMLPYQYMLIFKK